MPTQKQLIIATPGRSMMNITDVIAEEVLAANVTTGLCHVFIHHTSASLLICENSDPLVQEDFEAFMQRLSPDGDEIFKHIAEGPDDMSAHVRTMLTQSFLMIPITQHKLALGTWQGIYLWEHRIRAYERKITVTILG